VKSEPATVTTSEVAKSEPATVSVPALPTTTEVVKAATVTTSEVAKSEPATVAVVPALPTTTEVVKAATVTTTEVIKPDPAPVATVSTLSKTIEVVKSEPGAAKSEPESSASGDNDSPSHHKVEVKAFLFVLNNDPKVQEWKRSSGCLITGHSDHIAIAFAGSDHRLAAGEIYPHNARVGSCGFVINTRSAFCDTWDTLITALTRLRASVFDDAGTDVAVDSAADIL
jgi:hypothetical protein